VCEVPSIVSDIRLEQIVRLGVQGLRNQLGLDEAAVSLQRAFGGRAEVADELGVCEERRRPLEADVRSVAAPPPLLGTVDEVYLDRIEIDVAQSGTKVRIVLDGYGVEVVLETCPSPLCRRLTNASSGSGGSA
jgi:hypothetical protein